MVNLRSAKQHARWSGAESYLEEFTHEDTSKSDCYDRVCLLTNCVTPRLIYDLLAYCVTSLFKTKLRFHSHINTWQNVMDLFCLLDSDPVYIT